MPAVDAHQHLYPEAVLRALQERHSAPYARWRDGAFTVTLAGEAPFTVDAAAHDPDLRLVAMRAAGVDRALVALSSAIGVEALPTGEAAPILDAWDAACAALPTGLDAWGAVPLRASAEVQLARAEATLGAGAVGICLPTDAFTEGAQAVDRLGPLLELLERRLAPVFVHPGAVAAQAGAPRPQWWAPSATYVADLHAAWLAFVAYARPAHPGLQVLFAALAGLAPLHVERTQARGGPDVVATTDRGIFYDTSSYGPRATRAMTCLVGTTQLVDGSDHPVLPLRPAADPPTLTAVRADNTDRLLGRAWSAT